MKDDKDISIAVLVGLIGGVILSLAMYGVGSIIANLL